MTSNGHATRESFFATCQREYKDVTVPRIGTVRLRSLTEKELSEIQVRSEDKDNGTPAERAALFKSLVVAYTACNEENQLLFATDGDDLAKLQEMDSRAASALGNAIVDFCGLGGEAVEEAEKN